MIARLWQEALGIAAVERQIFLRLHDNAETRAPLCLLRDGKPFGYRELERCYVDDCGVDPELPALGSMLDAALRRSTLCDTLRFIYSSNETVIQYP